MNKYLRLPTHTKYGWLVFLGGFVSTAIIALPFQETVLPTIVFGPIQIVFAIGFLVEVIAKLIGKNRIYE